MFYEFEFFMPKDFLDLSRELLDKLDKFNSGISALKRTIYSRVYYSVFLHVREWLEDNTGYVSSIDDHRDIPDFLRLHGPFNPTKNMKLHQIWYY